MLLLTIVKIMTQFFLKLDDRIKIIDNEKIEESLLKKVV